MNERGLALHVNADAALVARGADRFTRGAVHARINELAAAFYARGVRRALVWSDDPVDLLRAIGAADVAGADLFIAHTNLPAAIVDEIAAQHGVQARIGETDTFVNADAPPASGRIYMMTSGTTGKPKIAAHTLDALMSRARAGAKSAQAADSKWLLTYQPTGFAGIQVLLTAVATQGLIVAPEQRTPGGFAAAARDHGVTQISGTPTFWRAFMMVARPSELALKQITLGGEAADQATLDRLKAAFPNTRVTHIYASTEAGVVFAVHDGREGFPKAWLDEPPTGVALRIVDGLLQIKSANLMGGYLGHDAQPLLDDGWLSTADRCEIAGDRVRILGRDDSTINVGGSKVYPLMVEQFLLQQTGVVEARVFAVPNPVSGSLVGAEIVFAEDQDHAEARARVLAACRDKLASNQVPRVVKIVDQISVRESGKKGAT
jgi:acyl-CoA synthetase (AMP-forming)/AMP-acid ligase II